MIAHLSNGNTALRSILSRTMPPIDPTLALSQFVGSLPTFVALILAWLQSNARITDTNARFDKGLDDLRELIRAESQATRTDLRAELRRVEEVMDARLKHLEENL